MQKHVICKILLDKIENILEVKEIHNLRNESYGPLVLIQANLRTIIKPKY